jgi:methylglyoxal synthase
VHECKTIALVAHDHRKRELAEWVDYNVGTLRQHHLVSTGTTGKVIADVVGADVPLTRLNSGPLGGDQQLGAMIAEERVDVLVFFWDPMEPQPHDVDVKALLRIAVVYDVPVACNRATADFLISSPLLAQAYTPRRDNYAAYLKRPVDGVEDDTPR